jgi:hypothetical protein
MKPLSSDTHPEAEKVLIEGYRRMTPAQKLQCLQQMVQRAEALQVAAIRRRYPHATEREVRLRTAVLWHGPELIRRAFGWDADLEGY